MKLISSLRLKASGRNWTELSLFFLSFQFWRLLEIESISCQTCKVTPRAITGPWPGLTGWRNVTIFNPLCFKYRPHLSCPVPTPPSTFDIGYFIFNYNLMVRAHNTLVTTETGWVPGDPSEKVQCYEYSQFRCRAEGPTVLLCSDTSDLRSNGSQGNILDLTDC